MPSPATAGALPPGALPPGAAPAAFPAGAVPSAAFPAGAIAASPPDDAPLFEEIFLVSASKADHAAEFADFMTQHANDLARTAWLLTGDTRQAEELTQVALTRTYLAWRKARERDPLAYARRTLANARIDMWRRRRREVLTAPSDIPPGAEADSAGLLAQRDQLVRALATLTRRQRRVVVLRHLEGLSEREVADTLGISVGTVKSTASRALTRLRAELGDTVDEEGQTR